MVQASKISLLFPILTDSSITPTFDSTRHNPKLSSFFSVDCRRLCLSRFSISKSLSQIAGGSARGVVGATVRIRPEGVQGRRRPVRGAQDEAQGRGRTDIPRRGQGRDHVDKQDGLRRVVGGSAPAKRPRVRDVVRVRAIHAHGQRRHRRHHREELLLPEQAAGVPRRVRQVLQVRGGRARDAVGAGGVEVAVVPV